ncbi:MAG: hypothetical protein NC200_02950 [Candidatus Gastranaerophilales bacterium]|nr:hypothetical protein [Candidatus Gastranaerophilales bacterium]
MNITPVSYRNVSMRSNNTQETQSAQPSKTEQKLNDLKDTLEKKEVSPAASGLVNGIIWGGSGFVFDRILTKMFKMGTSLKTSACINGIIGLGMGIYGYAQAKKAKKAQKAENAQNA